IWRRAAPSRETQWNRVLEQNAGLLLEPFAWIQWRSRTDAGSRYGCDAGKPDIGLDRREWGWRYRLHRHGPVCTFAAAQRADDLYRRKQRRVWSDERPILGNRRLRL